MDDKLRAIVFDMGNVLMTFDGPHFADLFTTSPADATLLNDALFGSTMWSLLDSGTITHETMLRYAENHLPERLHPNLHECFARWPEHSQPLQAANELGIRLKREGLGVYVLTNASTRVMDQLGHAPVIPYVDGVVVSAIERLMKPDPAIFTLLCERYGLDPASCLFVDDNADNCIGARVAGLHAHHFTGDVAALEATIQEPR